MGKARRNRNVNILHLGLCLSASTGHDPRHKEIPFGIGSLPHAHVQTMLYKMLLQDVTRVNLWSPKRESTLSRLSLHNINAPSMQKGL
jgi:hypothetical protein